MDFLIRIPILFLITAVSGYLYLLTKPNSLTESDYQSILSKINDEPYISSGGKDKNYANIVAIQPFMVPADYSTKERFFNKIESYIIKAKNCGFLKERTTVIFPEHLGTPLYLINENKAVYTANALKEAIYNIHKSNYGKYDVIPEIDTVEYGLSIFEKKKQIVREIYQSTFSDLAKIYKINILSGTILLPESIIKDGGIVFVSDSSNKKVYGFMFNSDGYVTQKLERKFVFDFEKNFIVPGKPQEEGITVPGIPNKMAVLLSGDTFFSSNYTRIIQVTDLWVSPSIKFQNESINFNGLVESKEINFPPKNINKDDPLYNERELWQRYGIPSKHASTSSKSYLQIFLNGKFYDIPLDSWSSLNSKGSSKQDFVDPQITSAILNVYL